MLAYSEDIVSNPILATIMQAAVRGAHKKGILGQGQLTVSPYWIRLAAGSFSIDLPGLNIRPRDFFGI